MKTLIPLQYTPCVAQYMLNEVLFNPGTYTNRYSIHVCPLRVLENGGVLESYTGDNAT